MTANTDGRLTYPPSHTPIPAQDTYLELEQFIIVNKEAQQEVVSVIFRERQYFVSNYSHLTVQWLTTGQIEKEFSSYVTGMKFIG